MTHGLTRNQIGYLRTLQQQGVLWSVRGGSGRRLEMLEDLESLGYVQIIRPDTGEWAAMLTLAGSSLIKEINAKENLN